MLSFRASFKLRGYPISNSIHPHDHPNGLPEKERCACIHPEKLKSLLRKKTGPKSKSNIVKSGSQQPSGVPTIGLLPSLLQKQIKSVKSFPDTNSICFARYPCHPDRNKLEKDPGNHFTFRNVFSCCHCNQPEHLVRRIC